MKKSTVSRINNPQIYLRNLIESSQQESSEDDLNLKIANDCYYSADDYDSSRDFYIKSKNVSYESIQNKLKHDIRIATITSKKGNNYVGLTYPILKPYVENDIINYRHVATQVISDFGKATYLTYIGGYQPIGNDVNPSNIYVSTGLATSLSVVEALKGFDDNALIINAIVDNNVLKVISMLKSIYSNHYNNDRIYLIPDNDIYIKREGGTASFSGMETALSVAKYFPSVRMVDIAVGDYISNAQRPTDANDVVGAFIDSDVVGQEFEYQDKKEVGLDYLRMLIEHSYSATDYVTQVLNHPLPVLDNQNPKITRELVPSQDDRLKLLTKNKWGVKQDNIALSPDPRGLAISTLDENIVSFYKEINEITDEKKRDLIDKNILRHIETQNKYLVNVYSFITHKLGAKTFLNIKNLSKKLGKLGYSSSSIRLNLDVNAVSSYSFPLYDLNVRASDLDHISSTGECKVEITQKFPYVYSHEFVIGDFIEASYDVFRNDLLEKDILNAGFTLAEFDIINRRWLDIYFTSRMLSNVDFNLIPKGGYVSNIDAKTFFNSPITALITSTGSGKTTAIKKFCDEAKKNELAPVVITPLRSLTTANAKKLNLLHYKELGKDGYENSSSAIANGISTTVHSIKKLEKLHAEKCALAIDEFVSVTKAISSEPFYKGTPIENIIEFRRLVRGAHTLLLSDATATTEDLNKFLKLFGINGKKVQVFDNLGGKENCDVFIYDKEKEIFSTLYDSVIKGNYVLVSCSSIAKVKEIKHTFLKRTRLTDSDILCLTEETSLEQRSIDFCESPNDEVDNYQVILMSPYVNSGISIDEFYNRRKRTIFSFMTDKVSDGNDWMQSISRYRTSKMNKNGERVSIHSYFERTSSNFIAYSLKQLVNFVEHNTQFKSIEKFAEAVNNELYSKTALDIEEWAVNLRDRRDDDVLKWCIKTGIKIHTGTACNTEILTEAYGEFKKAAVELEQKEIDELIAIFKEHGHVRGVELTQLQEKQKASRVSENERKLLRLGHIGKQFNYPDGAWMHNAINLSYSKQLYLYNRAGLCLEDTRHLISEKAAAFEEDWLKSSNSFIASHHKLFKYNTILYPASKMLFNILGISFDKNSKSGELEFNYKNPVIRLIDDNGKYTSDELKFLHYFILTGEVTDNIDDIHNLEINKDHLNSFLKRLFGIKNVEIGSGIIDIVVSMAKYFGLPVKAIEGIDGVAILSPYLTVKTPYNPLKVWNDDLTVFDSENQPVQYLHVIHKLILISMDTYSKQCLLD